MSLNDEFLKINNYQECNERREEFKQLDLCDNEILKHLDELFPKLDNSDLKNGIITEVYKKYP